jgi:hypothetical protein
MTKDLRDLLDELAREVTPSEKTPSNVMGRIARRQTYTIVTVAASVVLLVTGGLFAIDLVASREQTIAPVEDEAGCASGWHLEEPPHDSTSFRLEDVAASSTGDVWAVGTDYANGGPVALRNDGDAWVASDTGVTEAVELSSVDADSQGNVWAVGGDGVDPVVLTYDGEQWHRLPDVPNPGGRNGTSLSSVTAAGPSDVWVVGSFGIVEDGVSASRPLALWWDGQDWTVADVPGRGYLLDSVAGPDGNVVAVGGSQPSVSANAPKATALIAEWDGQAWADVTPSGANLPALGSIDLAGDGTGWAVGGTALLFYDGAAWTSQETRSLDRAGLGAASSGGDRSWVAGAMNDKPFVAQGSGGSWEPVDLPPGPFPRGTIQGMAVVDEQVWAVGDSHTPQENKRSGVIYRFCP